MKTKNNLTLGIDIGGTNTVLGFVDENGNYFAGSSIPTNSTKDVNNFIERLVKKIKLMLNENGAAYNFAGIGIAAPSANYFEGTIESPSNLKWGNVKIVKMLHEFFEIPIVIVNDANAAAVGEKYFGFAKNMRNFIVVTLGTGLGSGIVVDGNLLFGENGFAGEFGHTIIDHKGRLCNCGRHGCLETYASVIGLKRTVYDLLSFYNYPSVFRDIPFKNLTGEMIFEHAIKGDQIALKAYDFTGEKLGKSLANLVACFTSEAIILSGGLLKSGDFIINPTRKHFEDSLLKIHKNKVKIIKSKFDDGMAAVLGASKVILNEINGKPYIKKVPVNE